jgi:hypothetical protein
MGREGTPLGHLVLRSTLTLEPQDFYPLRHARMRMMIALLVQRLCVGLTACKSAHPLGHPCGAPDRCGAPSEKTDGFVTSVHGDCDRDTMTPAGGSR